MSVIRRGIAALVLCCGIAEAAEKTIDQQPLWELGVVTSAASFPGYPGADRNQFLLLPLPYAIYRGKTIRSDGGGVRGRYRFTPDTELDMSFGGALPVNSRDIPAREGMPDLDLLLEIGPRLTATFLRPRADSSLSLTLPIRAVFSTDFSGIDHRGFLSNPELVYTDRHLLQSDWKVRLGIGPVLATEALHAYFYEVSPEFVRADRPRFSARGGYLETRVSAALSRQFNKSMRLFFFARASSLQGAANANSPLLREELNWSIGAGLAYTFLRSTDNVASED